MDAMAGEAPFPLLQRLDASLEGRSRTLQGSTTCLQPLCQVAPEVGAKGLSVLARSPVGWDQAQLLNFEGKLYCKLCPLRITEAASELAQLLNLSP